MDPFCPLGHLLWNSFENRKQTFSGRKINHQSYGPATGDFFGIFFQFSFSGRRPTGNGAPFSINIRDRNWRLDLGSSHRGRQQALRYAENSNIAKAASLCQASNKSCAACCAMLPSPARLRHHHDPLGRACCDRVDDESSCDVAQPQFLPRRGRGG